jgi:hypothetical protein
VNEIWTVIEAPKGGHISAPYFWWARAWKWTDYGYGPDDIWVFTKLFVGPGAYDRAMAWSKETID